MKEILIGIMAVVVPQVLLVFTKQGATRAIGRNLSKFLRVTFGEKIENAVELTLLDIVYGAREDNEEAKAAIDKLEKDIREMRNDI